MPNPYRGEMRQPQRLPPRRIFEPADIFDYDRTKQPEDMQYEYKLVSVAGMEVPREVGLAERNGWKPVPPERHPELRGDRGSPTGTIVIGGQMLMELPKQYYQESRAEEEFKAKHTVEQQVQRLGLEGQRTGGQRGGVKRERRGTPVEIIE